METKLCFQIEKLNHRLFPNFQNKKMFHIFKTSYQGKRGRDEGEGDWKCLCCTTEAVYADASMGWLLEKSNAVLPSKGETHSAMNGQVELCLVCVLTP